MATTGNSFNVSSGINSTATVNNGDSTEDLFTVASNQFAIVSFTLISSATGTGVANTVCIGAAPSTATIAVLGTTADTVTRQYWLGPGTYSITLTGSGLSGNTVVRGFGVLYQNS